MATIRQRGTQFEVQIRRKGWPTLSKLFPDNAAARGWISVIESEMARGIFIDRTDVEKNTLGDLLGRYLTEVSEGKKGGLNQSVTGLRPYGAIQSPSIRSLACLERCSLSSETAVSSTSAGRQKIAILA